MISDSEWHYQTLLTDQNLLAMVRDLQPYFLSILPRLAPKVLESDEHYTLKDLHFYEKAERQTQRLGKTGKTKKRRNVKREC